MRGDMEFSPRVLVNGATVDPGTVVMPVTISHGRSSPESQPDAPSLNVTFLTVESAPVQGDRIEYWVSLPTPGAPPTYDDPNVAYDDPNVSYGGMWLSELPRFVGTVTDTTVTEFAGLPGLVSVVAISDQADLGRTLVTLSRAQEDDVIRVQAICAAVPIAVEVHGNPGPALAAWEYEGDALSALHEVCNSSAGLVWTDAAGVLHYGTADHRQIGVPVAAIPAHAIISGLSWVASLNDLINKLTISYGPQSAQGESVLTNDPSISVYGVLEKSASTMLADQSAADQVGNVILARRAFPYSRITDVMMDSDYLAGDDAAMISALQLRVSDAVFLPIPPDPGPAGLLAEWMVEGWQEEWPTRDTVRMQFAVTDRARFALTTLRKWSHAAEVTWADELTRGTWLDTLILGPEDDV